MTVASWKQGWYVAMFSHLSRCRNSCAHRGAIPADFDIAGTARQLGVYWDGARSAAAQGPRFSMSHAISPITYGGAAKPLRSRIRPQRQMAATEFNAGSSGAQYMCRGVPTPVVRQIPDATGEPVPAIVTEVWGSARRKRVTGVLSIGWRCRDCSPLWMTMQHALNAGGVSDSFASREQAGLDLRAAEIEVAEPTTFGGARIGVETGRAPAIASVLEHNTRR